MVKYTMAQVCSLLGEKRDNIRYYEKVLELEIERDDKSHRWFNEQDIEKIRIAKKLKSQGLGYAKIKEKLEQGFTDKTSSSMELREDLEENENIAYEEAALTALAVNELENQPPYEDTKEIHYNALMESLENNMQNSILKSIECLEEKIDKLQSSLIELQVSGKDILLNTEVLITKNREARYSIEKEMERHFREFDERLFQLRDKRCKRKKGLLRRLFKR